MPSAVSVPAKEDQITAGEGSLLTAVTATTTTIPAKARSPRAMNNTVRMNGSLAFGPPCTSVGNAQTDPRRGPCELPEAFRTRRARSSNCLVLLGISLPLPEIDLGRARPHAEEKPPLCGPFEVGSTGLEPVTYGSPSRRPGLFA